MEELLLTKYFTKIDEAWGDGVRGPKTGIPAGARSPTAGHLPSSKENRVGPKDRGWRSNALPTGRPKTVGRPILRIRPRHSRASRSTDSAQFRARRDGCRGRDPLAGSDQGKPRPASAENLMAASSSTPAPPRTAVRGARSFHGPPAGVGRLPRRPPILSDACWPTAVTAAGRGAEPLSSSKKPRLAGPWRDH